MHFIILTFTPSPMMFSRKGSVTQERTLTLLAEPHYTQLSRAIPTCSNIIGLIYRERCNSVQGDFYINFGSEALRRFNDTGCSLLELPTQCMIVRLANVSNSPFPFPMAKLRTDATPQNTPRQQHYLIPQLVYLIMAFASSAVETLRPMTPVSPVAATVSKHPSVSTVPSSIKDRTVVVFDWDDTLCPSSWLHAQDLLPKYRGQHINIASEQRHVLTLISEHVTRLLQKAVAYGPVFVVTAAEDGWVEMSAALYLPAVQSILALADVHIVSARNWYEQKFGLGGDSATWKQEVMQLIAYKCFTNATQDTLARPYRQSSAYFNFVSIGDSLAERDACFAAVQNVCHTFAKTLKFVEHPNAEEVLQQVKLTHNSFEQMCGWETNLDLRLSREQLAELRGTSAKREEHA